MQSRSWGQHGEGVLEQRPKQRSNPGAGDDTQKQSGAGADTGKQSRSRSRHGDAVLEQGRTRGIQSRSRGRHRDAVLEQGLTRGRSPGAEADTGKQSQSRDRHR
eukprot:g10725.t1